MKLLFLLSFLVGCAPMEPAYTRCDRARNECGELSCAGVGNDAPMTSFVCTPRCQVDADCPRPEGTNPVCVVGGCLLPCSTNTECPSQLECLLPSDGRMGVCG